MVISNSIFMILQENNNTKIQLKEWYKQSSGQFFKKIILKELESIKLFIKGHTLYFAVHLNMRKFLEITIVVLFSV